MRPVLQTIKPTSGMAHVLHMLLVLVLPVIIYILLSFPLIEPALAVVVLSKWRMFAVRPRFWPANIRANAVDLMVGLSIVIYMIHIVNNAGSQLLLAFWAVVYAIWLLAIKPRAGIPMVTLQAFIGQLAALMALYLVWGAEGPRWGLTLMTGLICYLAARHFLDTFDEPYAKMLAYIWGYFAAALAWLLSHWLLFYQGISQPALLLSTLGYGMAVLYYLDHNDRLSKAIRRQFIFIMLAIVVVVLAFSDWGDKVV
jgi:hypothetical protein